MKSFLEFRQDPVSRDWILVAGKRGKRPIYYSSTHQVHQFPKNSCPLEDPQKHGAAEPVAWYPEPDALKLGLLSKNLNHNHQLSGNWKKEWFIQIVPNPYPSVAPHASTCPGEATVGPHPIIAGQGFHEVFVTRPHNRIMAQFTIPEVILVLRAYQERYRQLASDPCMKYVLIFHNHGAEAGASIPHPHSQIMAVPIVPQDVGKSLEGSQQYFRRHKKCVHCVMIGWEMAEKKRIIFSNDYFVVVAPFASRVSYELRIYPLKHESNFEYMDVNDVPHLAEALITSLAKLFHGLNNISYNMFIHTTPVRSQRAAHYHWHIEILPKTSTWAGWELGTGIEVVAVSPEETAQLLKKIKIPLKM